MTFITRRRSLRNQLPKVAMAVVISTTEATTVATSTVTTRLESTRCVVRACRHAISCLFASVDECFQAKEAIRQRMEDLECVVNDDYKFLNQNVKKLFGMVGNIKKKWCSECGKFH
jgi:hypothetical protein